LGHKQPRYAFPNMLSESSNPNSTQSPAVNRPLYSQKPQNPLQEGDLDNSPSPTPVRWIGLCGGSLLPEQRPVQLTGVPARRDALLQEVSAGRTSA